MTRKSFLLIGLLCLALMMVFVESQSTTPTLEKGWQTAARWIQLRPGAR